MHSNITHTFKLKLLNVFLILTSLIGYLEWGGNNASFLFEAEKEIIVKLFSNPISAIHPLTILPLLGQIVLILSLFQKQPKKVLLYTGIMCLASLILLMLFIGIISLNSKIVFSTLPFLVTSIITIIYLKKIKL